MYVSVITSDDMIAWSYSEYKPTKYVSAASCILNLQMLLNTNIKSNCKMSWRMKYFIAGLWIVWLINWGDAGITALQSGPSEAVGGIERKSTRVWAEQTGYNPQKLFNKVCG